MANRTGQEDNNDPQTIQRNNKIKQCEPHYKPGFNSSTPGG
jgi:hypothetical protein